jgi:chemotaxis response regulator CheB
MILPPLTIYAMHRDSSCRAHIASTTNPDCRLTSRDGESLHVPVDGRVYVVETRSEHTAFNAGAEERVHLTMSMADTERD